MSWCAAKKTTRLSSSQQSGQADCSRGTLFVGSSSGGSRLGGGGRLQQLITDQVFQRANTRLGLISIV
ncbi:hypothetical protein TYRP_021117 [Tyrophagus putrescentiae]|nr:hypothetical protein TYRP_021117 [Tyrophagus putrescentiae]